MPVFSGIPGDEFVYSEGESTFKMYLLCKTTDRLWFSNGFSFGLDTGLEKTGKHVSSFMIGANLWPYLSDYLNTGDWSNLTPGDGVIIFDESCWMATPDVIAVKDSDRKMFVTANGNILSFNERRVVPTGFSVKLEEIKLSDEAAHFLHQMYDS